MEKNEIILILEGTIKYGYEPTCGCFECKKRKEALEYVLKKYKKLPKKRGRPKKEKK